MTIRIEIHGVKGELADLKGVIGIIQKIDWKQLDGHKKDVKILRLTATDLERPRMAKRSFKEDEKEEPGFDPVAFFRSLGRRIKPVRREDAGRLPGCARF